MTANCQSSVDSTRFIHPMHGLLMPLWATVAEATPRLDRRSAITASTNR